ncbi:TetR/AcrR family transcriptional regulator [Pseudonocardiaceae bacterium YIM PH 21723]|nr:TetR/AcrR family transcriptional regulator [Pseudonocardiaceae bacterium YIM PH 21723]
MPKIIGGSLAEHRAQTRERIFTAFAGLLYERGFDAVTLSEIATAAGVGRTAMYNHFPDKESLLVAYAIEETERYLTGLRSALREVETPVDSLATFIRYQLRLFSSQHLPPGAALRSLLSEQAFAQMREHAAAIEDTLRDILKTGQQTGAFQLISVNETVILVNAVLSGRSLTGVTGAELDAAIESTVAFVLRAVGAE